MDFLSASCDQED